MPPVSLSDNELDVVKGLAAALPPQSRDEFMQVIASRLADHPEGSRGIGLLYRIAAEAQRTFLQSGPIAVGRKYSRPYFVRNERR